WSAPTALRPASASNPNVLTRRVRVMSVVQRALKDPVADQVAIRLRHLRPALRHQFTIHPGVLDPVVEDRIPRIARLDDQHWRVDEAGDVHEGAIRSENASEVRCRPAGVARET